MKRKREEENEQTEVTPPIPTGFVNLQQALLADHDTIDGRPVDSGKPISDDTLSKLAKTSRQNKRLFQPFLHNRAPRKLNQAVNHADLTLSDSILEGTIKSIPNLLSTNSTFKEPCGRVLDGTRYQWALKNHDSGICRMMDKHIEKLQNGREERIKQIKEIFPNGVKAHFDAQEPYNFNTLINAITQSPAADIQAALNKQQNGSLLCRELDNFRTQFDALSQGEKVYNTTHLKEILHLMYINFRTWIGDVNNPDWSRCDLVWRQVHGYIFRHAPAVYKRAACHGYSNLLIKKPSDELRRSLLADASEEESQRWMNLHTLDADPDYRLGYDYSIYAYRCVRRNILQNEWIVFEFDRFCQLMQDDLEEYCHRWLASPTQDSQLSTFTGSVTL